MTRSAKLAIAAAALCVAVTPTAHAAKPAPSGSTAPAQVFFPNPVQSLRDETLTDQKDANYPALAAAYARKTLTDLDGSGTLTGAYAKVESETGTPARNTGNGFIYTRDQDQFEQVMAYYWLTQAQRYIQSLGFGTTLPSVNKRQQLVRINQFGGDNSFYRNGTKKLTITYGKGGVDDAEDAEVIVHEYGHSVQDDQVPGFGSTLEAGSIGEAFGDYLAVTVSSAVTHETAFQEPCVADWDSTSYTPGPVHCLRRLDSTKHYPQDVEGEVHADGEMWSGALWRARGLIGNTTLTDRVIIAAQFGFKPDTSFRAAAEQTIADGTALRGGEPVPAGVHRARLPGLGGGDGAPARRAVRQQLSTGSTAATSCKATSTVRPSTDTRSVPGLAWTSDPHARSPLLAWTATSCPPALSPAGCGHQPEAVPSASAATATNVKSRPRLRRCASRSRSASAD